MATKRGREVASDGGMSSRESHNRLSHERIRLYNN